MSFPGFPPRTTARWEPNVRPRICPRCDHRCPDRVYHDRGTGRCLPIFDHYCPWLLVSVYSRTIKAYLYTLLFLFFDILGTFVVIVMALTTPSARSIGPFVATGVFALVVLIFGVFMWGPSQWWHLALNNEVYFEHRNPKQPKFLAFKVTQGGRDFLYFDDFVGNPWDRGYMNNLRQVLGSSWWMVRLTSLFRWLNSTNLFKVAHVLVAARTSRKVWSLRARYRPAFQR
jgi:hypothetical protein